MQTEHSTLDSALTTQTSESTGGGAPSSRAGPRGRSALPAAPCSRSSCITGPRQPQLSTQRYPHKMSWRVVNKGGKYRVVVTKELPGSRWLDALLAVDCEVHISNTTHILSNAEIIAAIGDKCDGVLGQLTEDWGAELFSALKAAGGKVR